MACRETLAWVAQLISKSRSPTPPIWMFHFVLARANFIRNPVAINSPELGHALELHKLGGVYIQRLWVYRLPLALAWWARGSTAVKRSLFNSGVGRNIWLSIQIFDLDRRDPAPCSGFRDRGGGDFNEKSLPTRDPRGAKCP
jgi:hypothetical protein